MINIVSLDEEDFEINKDLLRKDFYSEVNKERRVWFFSKVPKEIWTLYQEEFLNHQNLNLVKLFLPIKCFEVNKLN